MSKITFGSDFEERAIHFADGSRAFYHGNVWPNIESMRAKISAKHQNVILITGRTGTGKSEFAIQMAKALDPHFTIDNIFWNTDELIKVAASKENIKPPGTAFIFDEAREGTQSLNAMTETNRRMGLFLDTIRSRGYHIFLLQPSYFLFQKSIAIYAADILFHIEKRGNPEFYNSLKLGLFGDDNPHEPFTRGIGRIYDVNQKKAVYIKGKRMEDMDASSCTWFTFKKSHGIVDWDEYERRKTVAVAAMNEAFDKEIEPKLNKKAESILLFKQKAYYLLKTRYGMSVNQMSNYFEEKSAAAIRDYIIRETDRLTELAKEDTEDVENEEKEDEEEDEFSNNEDL
jgi:energy-coupling factor transporter ATP-binding protein EcfA2